MLSIIGYSLLSTFIVSIIPVIFLLLVPLITSTKTAKKDKKDNNNNNNLSISHKWLTYFLCFAAGALLGDAFLHLIPGDHHDSTDFKYNGLAILSGIIAFFSIEIFSNSHSHSHSHSNTATPSKNKNKSESNVNGLLSLIADSVHNFTDGLTIAAAYASSTSAGISTTIAIFVHEIPHELGDYAILTKAGYSHNEVLKCQFLTAIAAFIGTIVGLSLQSSSNTLIHSITTAILPFSAGGFIYLALGSIIPEILHDHTSSPVLKFVIFLSGILLMTVLE